METIFFPRGTILESLEVGCPYGAFMRFSKGSTPAEVDTFLKAHFIQDIQTS